MKGAVLIIGSLLWETELNSLNKTQGKLREEWRRNLDLENKIFVKAPIRYGKRSSTRKCTYTMVFSNSVASLGTAVIIPYKKATNDFNELKEQAIALSKAEGISNEKYPNRLISSWGAVGIYFNKQKYNNEADVKMNWHQEYNQFNNMDYKIPPEIPAISENGEINFNIIIPDIFDYVFATIVKPNIAEYPNSEKIAEAVLETNPKYDTYIIENYTNGIRVENDDEIIKRLK